MPIIALNNYKPPLIFRNKHINTIAPALLRKVKGVAYTRHRINTDDGDFIDIDRVSTGSSAVLIISHGLEGNSYKAYVKGSANTAAKIGMDAIAVNLRGCSEEPNKLLSSYHSGKTDDLELVINHCIKKFAYEKIYLLGYSLGGNITLKFVGEKGTSISDKIGGAIGVSVPCDLKSSSVQLSKRANWVYLQRFMRSLKRKALYKIENHKVTTISKNDIKKANNFHDYDDLFTAPVHGFASAEDYYEKCSSKYFLSDIKVPTLIINALDDPFLGKECYPFREARENDFVFLETPKYGGHVGFSNGFPFKEQLWHEKRIATFLQEYSLGQNN